MKFNPTESGLREVQSLLMRAGVPNEKLRLDASLIDDLKLHPNDYYFLTLDIEELLHKPVDIDLVFDSKTVSDLVTLVTKEKVRAEGAISNI